MPTFTQLREGHICGIIDAHGAAHSQFTGEDMRFHGDLYPNYLGSAKWRWNFDQAIYLIPGAAKLSPDEFEAIQRHLTRRYGIQWWENGHHDIDHFLVRLERERKKAPKISSLSS